MSHKNPKSMYEESGGDPNVCEICELPLDGEEPYEEGMDGARAHTKCLDGLLGRKRRKR